MKPSRKTILEEKGNHVLSHLPYQEWRQVGHSYFIRVNRVSRNVLCRVKVIERDEKILVFAYYVTTPQGGKGLLGYEVRPLLTPLSSRTWSVPPSSSDTAKKAPLLTATTKW